MLIERHKEIWTLASQLRHGEFEILGRIRLAEIAGDETHSKIVKSHATKIISELKALAPKKKKHRF